MSTFTPDHNGECTHCDERLDAHGEDRTCPTDPGQAVVNQERYWRSAPPPLGGPTCPCALAVRLDYTGFDPDQVRAGLALIAELGEWTTVTVVGKEEGPRAYRVSRHCILLHGVVAARIADYGFEELQP